MLTILSLKTTNSIQFSVLVAGSSLEDASAIGGITIVLK